MAISFLFFLSLFFKSLFHSVCDAAKPKFVPASFLSVQKIRSRKKMQSAVVDFPPSVMTIIT